MISLDRRAIEYLGLAMSSGFMKSLFALLLSATFLALLSCTGCGTPESETSDELSSSSATLKLVSTTGQIHSALVRITKGTDASIKLLCGPGVDPHSFSASTRDIQAMKDADAIFFNGYHLEARLDELLHTTFQDKSWSMASAFPEEYRLEWIEDGVVAADGSFDPHIWNCLPAWAECVRAMADKLSAIDPDNSLKYQANTEFYCNEMIETHEWAKQKLSELPKERRIIVSAHDAFNYFANAYEMETLAVLGIGNDPESDIKTMRKVAEQICDKKVPVLFLESITNPKVTQALKEACASRDWQVEIVSQQLYSDDLGEESPVNTFLGAFRSNVEIIHNSLIK